MEDSQTHEIAKAYARCSDEAGQLVRRLLERNATLESKIRDAESELGLWKNVPHNGVETNATLLEHRLQNMVLEIDQPRAENGSSSDHPSASPTPSLTTSSSPRGEIPVVGIVVNGHGSVFTPELVLQGREGGVKAAQALYKRVSSIVSSIMNLHNANIFCQVFYNRVSFQQSIAEQDISENGTSAQFVLGFNEVYAKFNMIDSGSSKDLADSKLRDHVAMWTQISACRLICVRVADPDMLARRITNMKTDGHLAKVALMKTETDIPLPEVTALSLPEIDTTGLFVSEALQTPRHLERSFFSGIAAAGQPTSYPQSIDRSVHPMHSPPLGLSSMVIRPPPSRVPDPTKPLGKQIPKPPCNRHYLVPDGCRDRNCTYGHDWILTAAHVETLRRDAKKSPCVYILRGKICPDGPNCHLGHACPFGARCRYGSACKFIAPGMHDVSPISTRSGSIWDDDAVFPYRP